MEGGKSHRRERFTNHRSNFAANQVLSNALKLQDQKCISAYLLSLGLDDQDPAQLGDAELSHLVVPEADYASDSEEEEEEEGMSSEEEEQQQQPICRILWFLILTTSDSEEEEGEEEQEQEQEQEQHQSSPHIDDTPRKRSRR